MKISILKRRLWTAALLGLLVAVGVACNKDDYEPSRPKPTQSVEDILSANADLSMFKSAMEIAGLNTFILGKGPYTYLAPVNTAFAAIGLNSPADLQAIPKEALISILTYHFRAALQTSFEFPNGPNANIATQGGFSFYAHKVDGKLYINGAEVLETDLEGFNGIIHKISRVLIPPATNTALFLPAIGGKLFGQAVVRAGIAATLTGTGVNTVFAPTDAAMTAAGYDSATISVTPAATLLPIVRYHIVAGRRFSSNFVTDSLKTLSVPGPSIYMTQGTPTTVKGPGNTTAVNIIAVDQATSNGIIHTIDGVLRRE